MGKIYKAALVLFYLLQLVIVFHEQIMHLFNSAASPIHDSASTQEPHSGFLMRLRQAMEQHQAAGVVLQSEKRGASIEAVVSRTDEPDHDVHHEEKSNHQKRPKRGPVRQFLIANLFPSIKKLSSPAGRREAFRGCDLARFIAFPSNACTKA